MKAPTPRKAMPSPALDKAAFRERFLGQFIDPVFTPLEDQLSLIADAAWDAYSGGRKSPLTRKAGQGYADPSFELSQDWLAARATVDAAQTRHDDKNGPDRYLIVNASPRSEHTCPGESSKTWRLAEIAQAAIEEKEGAETEILDLSRLASEYGRKIHPCKACFSTAAALCHWPCSCYPNYSLGQTQDYMNEIYPKWVAAHGVMIMTPVHWYMASSPLKLMMDRLVCADGGNPDPTLTRGKDPMRAKETELKGWAYPRHLAGRFFAVVVHGDFEGAENVRRAIVDWLRFMQLRSAGEKAEIDRYVGYWEPYATSHAALDKDEALKEEVRNAARTLRDAVRADWAGKFVEPGADLAAPRQK
ncbi:MAG: flavodoxin family protein [Amphiplicatus sp.]